MCLNRLTKATHTSGRGWKVFRVADNGLLHSLLQIAGMYREGEWIRDPKLPEKCLTTSPLLGNLPDIYPTGFHIFVKKEDAAQHANGATGEVTLREVSYDEVVAEGVASSFIGPPRQDLPVVVARRMFIHPEVQSAV